jgi:hypothetical protein
MRIFNCKAAVMAASLVAALSATAPGAAQAATVSITPSTSSVTVGDVFSVRVGIADLSAASGSSLSAFDFTLSFDNTAVSWLGFSLVDASSGLNQLDFAEAGSFGFFGDAYDTGSSSNSAFGLSGNSAGVLDTLQADAFDFITLSFQALAPRASAVFAIDASDPALLFVDSDAATLAVAFASASASVAIGGGGTGIPEPSTSLLVLGALGALVAAAGHRPLRWH